jgi:hypothetical protein
MTDTQAKPDGPPADLPTDCSAFFAMREPLEGPLVVHLDTTSPLERLGPSPFPKAGFPLLGFLETVYDHIATQAV